MASHFATLKEAKVAWSSRTCLPKDQYNKSTSGVSIWNRNKFRKKNKLKKPYFVGTQLEWLNIG